ncbi:hypothetical protein PAPHI01_1476 [Pancytospora philotis]|nr:hypothetical protein PAPHI01_1476 [Pancytospora philotis]
MATKTKVYRIKVPFDAHEWRRGSRYILTKLTTEEVQIVYHTMSHGKTSVTTKTHKILDVKAKVPYIVRKLIPDSACIVDEFSTNIDSAIVTVVDPAGNAQTGQAYNIETRVENEEGVVAEVKATKDGVVSPENLAGTVNQLGNINVNEELADCKEDGGPSRVTVKEADKSGDSEASAGNGLSKLMSKCTTVYKNRYFDPATFSLEVATMAVAEPKENIFDLEKAHKEEDLDFRTYNKSSLLRAGERSYEGDWGERYPVTYVYKCVDVSVNSFGLGWVAGEVDKMIRNLLVSVQQKIIETYDEWSKLSDEEIGELEEQMVKKFVVKVEDN